MREGRGDVSWIVQAIPERVRRYGGQGLRLKWTHAAAEVGDGGRRCPETS